MEEESFWGVLPKDVLVNILFFLEDGQDLASAMLVNHEWLQAGSTRNVWHKHRITLRTPLHRLPTYAANVLVTQGGISGFFNTIRAGLESELVPALHTVVIRDLDVFFHLQEWRLMGHLTGLQALEIGCWMAGYCSQPALTHPFAEVLGSMTQLQVLDISHLLLHASREAWPHLSKLTNLHALNLAGNTLHKIGIQWVTALTSLTRLNISHCGTPDLHLLVGPHMINLKSLAVAGNGYTGVGEAQSIAALTNLRQLDVSMCAIQSEGLGSLSNLRNLTELKAGGTLGRQDSSAWAMSHLSTLTNLKYLDLNHNYLDDEAVGHLARMVSVRTLLLDGNGTLPLGHARLLSQLTNLEHLGVSSNYIDASGLQCFNNSLHNLHTLNASSIHLRGNRVSFSGLLKLQHLDLSVNHQMGESVGTSVLLVLTNLQSLNLRETFVSLPDIQQLSSLPTLHTLNLSYNALTSEVADYLTGLSSLRSLDLAGNMLGDTAHPIHALNSLSHLHSLAALDVSRNRMGPEALPPLCMLTGLTELGAHFNRLGVLPSGQDPSACFETLAGMQKLRKLNLRSNRIKKVFQYVFRSVSRLSQLYLLNVQSNELCQTNVQQLSVLTNLIVMK